MDSFPDGEFYQTVRMVHHLDSVARQQISDIYSQLLTSGTQLLDLMSSWESHLPDSLNDIHVTGLGMNPSEMAANPKLDRFIIHDLNQEDSLPFKKHTFDYVICTASVEYLINPVNVFYVVKRILKPGGKFVVMFSNRWFPAKAIMLWSEIHEFERIALVSEYFRLSDWSDAINTYSCRGLTRPENDVYYKQTQLSDPVFAVWVQK